ncbi:MAG TPA: phosphopantetheine-binding protein [Verrucomicrobiae bacterium]|nr:phosphopantetheine-binding protein [Verrucomicrobiae bacterium]
MNAADRIRRLTPEQRSLLLERLEPADDANGARKALAAFVTLREGAAATPEEIRAFCAARLPDFMVPASIIRLDKLPLHPNGKVDRKALPSMESAAPQNTGASRPPTEIESRLALLWADVLRVQNVGLNDNFFQLGGHSLLALQLMARVRDTFKADLPIRTLFTAPTVAGLAKAVEQRAGTAPAIRRVNRAPLTPRATSAADSTLP